MSMSLPPAEELSRWTVGQVNSWLTKCSLTVFRDEFLRDKIDGSKLMRIQPQDVDIKYNSIPAHKRLILKEHLNKIESPKSPPSWNITPAPPQLPPRPGPRGPAPVPQSIDDGDGSDDGWGSDDFDADDDVDEEYLEPTTTPAHIKKTAGDPGRNMNGLHRQPLPHPEEPQSEYEIPPDEEFSARQSESTGLQRKPTLVDRLKNELQIRKRDSQVQPDAPPPRPPRLNKPGSDGPSYFNTHSEQGVTSSSAPQPLPGRRGPPPQPAPPPQVLLPPDDVYEPVDNSPTEPESGDAEYLCPEAADVKPNNYLDFSETCKKGMESRLAGSRVSGEVRLPPRPVRKDSGEKPPQPAPQPGGWLFNNEQATPTTKQDTLNNYEWYHGKISRDHAEAIFHREQKDGMFLIRKSERDPQQPFTLVIWHCNRIWNIPIRKVGNDKFAAGKLKELETHFSSLPDLVEHFKVVSLNLKSDNQVQGSHNLRVPAPRK